MDASTLLADPKALQLESFLSEQNSITIVVRSIQAQPFCPLCSHPSSNLHSNYVRRITHLPWHGVAVGLELHTRKFRCRNELCRRKVFCERLPEVVAAMGRKTCRLNAALTFLAFALGGEAGARTAQKLNLQISGDSLLRRVRQFSSNQQPTSAVKVLGVDDFAFRRGERYGTMLVDLEKRQPVDLLPDREAKTFQEWLELHPGVELISRDRGGGYAAGARAGAPPAIQVADRFHLLKNLLDGFEKFLSRQHEIIRAAFDSVFQLPVQKENSSASAPGSKKLTATQQLMAEQKRAKRTAHERHFQTVKQLHCDGVPILRIARQLRMSHNTVKKFLKLDTAASRQPPRQRFSPIHRFVPFLRQRWGQGERNGRKLWQEIKAQGYPGAEETLRHFLQKWRDSNGEQVETRAAVKDSKGRAPSAKQTKWLLFGSCKRNKQWEAEFLQQLCQNSPEIANARVLTKEFHQILMSRREQSQVLQLWLEKARASGIGEFIWCANGVEQDVAAVESACSSQWSRGQVEGQVNRLKFLKRRMYGRAKFDLLRARVLYQS